MRDLTHGSVVRHLFSMAAVIGIGMLFQSAYYLIDLYFVAGLGGPAVAGVGSAGNVSFLAMSASQLVAVGTTTLIAQAVGRREPEAARRVFAQSAAIAAAAGGATLLLGYAFGGPLARALAADEPTAGFGYRYLLAYIPCLAFMFPMTALTAALRGAGLVQPTMVAQIVAVVLNAVLAPVFVAGWGTGYPLGAFGAGLASSVASAVALLGLIAAFPRLAPELQPHFAALRPRYAEWWRIIRMGLPVAGEFGAMFVISSVVYLVIRPFGASAQAGFGVGSRIMTSIFLPAMAIAFAVSPVVGQNVGAKRPDRVMAAFYAAAAIGSGIMLLLTFVCQWRAPLLIHIFTADPAVTADAALYLHIQSWNFVGVGLVFAASGLFQGLGNTLPSFISSASRMVTLVLPLLIISRRPDFALPMVWHLSVASIAAQAMLSMFLVWRATRGVRARAMQLAAA